MFFALLAFFTPFFLALVVILAAAEGAFGPLVQFLTIGSTICLPAYFLAKYIKKTRDASQIGRRLF